MKEQWLTACSRAFSHVVERKNEPLFEGLLKKIRWELREVVSPQVRDLGILCRRSDGSFVCGRDDCREGMPTESIMGLLLEAIRDDAAHRVTDHALDPLRFLDSGGGLRASILVRFRIPGELLRDSEVALWVGMLCGVAPAHLEEAKELAHSLEVWFAQHGELIKWAEDMRSRLARAEKHLYEVSSLAHDARAPVTALRSLLERRLEDTGDRGAEAQAIATEFDYLEALLSRCSPRVLGGDGEKVTECDVPVVVERVVGRFHRAAQECGIAIRTQFGNSPLRIAMPALEFERVLVNLVGNSLRYGARRLIEISVDREVSSARLSVSVCDDGPGFSADLLQRFRAGGEVVGEGSGGWGLGLLSSRRRLEAYAASMELLFSQTGGARVDLAVPLGHSMRCEGEMSGEGTSKHERGGPDTEVRVFIVDDDPDHANSLVKLLASRGLGARSFVSITQALGELSSSDVVILCDANMPDGGAEQLLIRMRRQKFGQRVGVMSGDFDDDLLYRVASVGAQAFFSKPVALDEIMAWV